MSASESGSKATGFKLTYATMFDPPEELHTRYEQAVEKFRSDMGQDVPMYVGGEDVFYDDKFEDRSPINQDWLLGTFQRGTEVHAELALTAAREAFPGWEGIGWQKRVELLRRAADLIDERIFEFAAVISVEVGKNRMEALGDAAEAADLMRYACDQMEANDGYVVKMGKDPLSGYEATNHSVLRPHGVWIVISPFNFPAALTGGPAGAALLAGNTIIMKPAHDTPYTSRLLAECFRDAGLPTGVFNFVTGPGSSLGEALITSGKFDGITFTGSFDIGMHIYRTVSQGLYPKPTILEMGGKNPAIVSRHADLERAITGILRSAFGLQGQKCSAASRIYVERPVYQDLVEGLVSRTESLVVGDPTLRDVFLGPVINQAAYDSFKQHNEELSEAATFLTGGKVLSGGAFDKGFYCQPTIVADAPLDHRLWNYEMFLPITMVHAVDNLEQAMDLANSVHFGLTAGFYGSDEEADWFFKGIQAGVNYVNRPQGATTGAWPGYQPFGGWKGSGSTGKNAGGHYYLPLYMREQVQTVIR